MGSSTAIFVASTSPYMFLAARALQGVSGAAMGVVGLCLTIDTVGNDALAQPMGYSALALTWAILLGPMFGGIM